MNEKNFKEKYLKDDNIFLLIQAKKPIKDGKRTHWVTVDVQLVIQADGTFAGRLV